MCELQLCWAAQIYREFSKYVYVCFKNEKIQGSLAALLDLAMVKSRDKNEGRRGGVHTHVREQYYFYQ